MSDTAWLGAGIALALLVVALIGWWGSRPPKDQPYPDREW